jgi:hypothetical protein
MDRDDFLDNIRRQYADEIHEAYLECEHETGKVDFAQLNKKLGKLMKSAKAEGLQNKEFIDLAMSTLPPEAKNSLRFESTKKAA